MPERLGDSKGVVAAHVAWKFATRGRPMQASFERKPSTGRAVDAATCLSESRARRASNVMRSFVEPLAGRVRLPLRATRLSLDLGLFQCSIITPSDWWAEAEV